MTCVKIDPNVRVRGNGTYAGLEDVDGPLAVGEEVQVVEPESELVGTGRVTEIDTARELVYLSLDWASLHGPDGQSGGEPWRVAWTYGLPGVRLLLGDLQVAMALGEASQAAAQMRTAWVSPLHLSGWVGTHALPLLFDLSPRARFADDAAGQGKVRVAA